MGPGRSVFAGPVVQGGQLCDGLFVGAGSHGCLDDVAGGLQADVPVVGEKTAG
ncbi:hypothetical protein [Actinophytocola oryzae]|uniref:hypothetical protein n=1 Tax=Actinophytocola oryzae TaxID=502181 RepID=UPI001FBB5C96|nr:hypothetical protein [Actinophytocola oryzae]